MPIFTIKVWLKILARPSVLIGFNIMLFIRNPVDVLLFIKIINLITVFYSLRDKFCNTGKEDRQPCSLVYDVLVSFQTYKIRIIGIILCQKFYKLTFGNSKVFLVIRAGVIRRTMATRHYSSIRIHNLQMLTIDRRLVILILDK